jgi:hypothetical protein
VHGDASLIMHSYLDRQQIATQMTTQRSDTVDLYGVFTPIHFMRNGFTAYLALSGVPGCAEISIHFGKMEEQFSTRKGKSPDQIEALREIGF